MESEGGSRSHSVPVIYSCSGCSSAAQMANDIALELDRQKFGEMSCIAGVGGDVPSLVAIAKSKRSKVVIDGCPLSCAKHCLLRHGVEPDLHFVLSTFGVTKKKHETYQETDRERVMGEISKSLAAFKK